MSLQRLMIPPGLDNRLRYLIGRTGLTANLLCRCAFCLSLDEPGIPDLVLYGGVGEGQGREMNRYTLLGEYDLYFFALLRERLLQDALPLTEESIEQQFKAHLFRGIQFLAGRINSLEDLADLVAEAALPPGFDEGELVPSPLDEHPRGEHVDAQEVVNNDEQPSSAAERGSLVSPDLLMNRSTPSLWEQDPPSLEIPLSAGRPRLSLALASDGETRLVNDMVTHHHYLHTPVDVRCSILAYIVLLGNLPIGCVMFGRPEATRVGGWYGDVAEREAGACRYSRWEIINLARLWFDPVVQQGGCWYSPDLIPGFEDRRGVFHSQLATRVIAMALSCLPVDYLIAYPPVDISQPYQIQECLSYCNPDLHKGTVYRQAGFRLERKNGRGLQTFAIPIRPLTQGEDAYIRFLAEYSPRSRHYRALQALTGSYLQLPLAGIST